MREDIMDWVRAEYGCAASAGIYRKIEQWEDWWRGKCRGFHEYWENSAAGGPIRRELYSLRMAKKLCEDWAALLLNDRTYFRAEGTAGPYLSAIFARESFWERSNHLVERAFASGTGACLLRLQNAVIGERGELLPGEGTRVRFDFVSGGHIIPISVSGGHIIEAAFVSELCHRGENYVYVEVHLLEEDGYVIRNRYFRDGEFGAELDAAALPPEMAPGILRTGCPYPFFAILTPNLQNAAEEGCGLGQSIYADAIDCLKGVDLAFNNFCRDLKLGGKKVFINQSLVARDAYGNAYTPDDVAQQLFVTVGDVDLAEHPLIEEHNPTLRTEENRDAVQSQLDYLAFRCGLGAKHYLFGSVDGKTRLTATQYMGERQDTRQNIVKHTKNVTTYVLSVIRPLLWLAVHRFGQTDVDENAAVELHYDDSYFTDTESDRSRDLREVETGVMTRDEFRSRWYHAGAGNVGNGGDGGRGRV